METKEIKQAIERLINEKEETEARYIKLGSFLQSGKHRNFSGHAADLLELQFNAMSQYLNILEMRISDLKQSS